MSHEIIHQADLAQCVRDVVRTTPITDMHTHLYPPDFGDMMLWGIDDLLTYHYLIAETLRHSTLSYQQFWDLSKRGQAEHIWQTLFLDNSPYSEACRGVLTTLSELGCDAGNRALEAHRQWYGKLHAQDAIDLIFRTAGVREVVMTNDPFDDQERAIWLSDARHRVLANPHFRAALRLDALLNHWPDKAPQLRSWGYQVADTWETDQEKTESEIKRFLIDWARRMKALYAAVSLPSDFRYPTNDVRTRLIDRCVLPACRELGIPFAMMIGVKRQINKALRSAGDGSGQADLEAVTQMCASHPHNRFFVTVLARENQHELNVIARKFRNLMPFGCWWFMNNPSLVKETTQMRCELLGTSFIPQHSDARILDQLVYKWSHARTIIADTLITQYSNILATGWQIETVQIERDVSRLFQGNFEHFTQGA